MPPYSFDCLCRTARNWTSASLNVGPTDTHGGDIQWHSSTKNTHSRALCGEVSCRGTAKQIGIRLLCAARKKNTEKKTTLMRNAFLYLQPRRRCVIM